MAGRASEDGREGSSAGRCEPAGQTPGAIRWSGPSCARGRELGHLGRASIHPDQLLAIEQRYFPSDADVERARELLAQGEGASALADGSFVDEAILRQARQVAALADRYGTRSSP